MGSNSDRQTSYPNSKLDSRIELSIPNATLLDDKYYKFMQMDVTKRRGISGKGGDDDVDDDTDDGYDDPRHNQKPNGSTTEYFKNVVSANDLKKLETLKSKAKQATHNKVEQPQQSMKKLLDVVQGLKNENLELKIRLIELEKMSSQDTRKHVTIKKDCKDMQVQTNLDNYNMDELMKARLLKRQLLEKRLKLKEANGKAKVVKRDQFVQTEPASLQRNFAHTTGSNIYETIDETNRFANLTSQPISSTFRESDFTDNKSYPVHVLNAKQKMILEYLSQLDGSLSKSLRKLKTKQRIGLNT